MLSSELANWRSANSPREHARVASVQWESHGRRVDTSALSKYSNFIWMCQYMPTHIYLNYLVFATLTKSNPLLSIYIYLSLLGN